MIMGAKSILIGSLLGLVVLLAIIAADEEVEEIQIPEKIRHIPYDEMTSQLVAQSAMNFAHNLAVALDTNEYPNTQIFSPLSVMSALSILQMGSSGNSYNQLNQQLFNLLNEGNATSSSKIHEEFGWLLEDVMMKNNINQKRLRSSTEWRTKPFDNHGFSRGGTNELDDHTIRVSNAVFIQTGFSLRPDYAYAAQSVYKSEVTPLDFSHNPKQSKDYINSWVNQNTLGKIPTLIDDELSSETKMVLASTLYFQGFWEMVFYDANGNKKEAFYPDGPESLPVEITMMNTGGSFPYYHSDEYNCRIIGLPYKGNQTTMYVIQPDDSSRLNLQQLQKNLTGKLINELISKMEYRTATLSFPKFHVENKMHLKPALTRMGIEDIFINGRADLALIADPDENTEKALAAASSSSSGSSWGAHPVPVPQELEVALNTYEDLSSSSSVDAKSSLFPYTDVFDRYGDAPLLFSSRFGEESINQTTVIEKPENDDYLMVTTLLTPSDDEDDIETTEIAEENTTIIPSESTTESKPKDDKSSPRKMRETIPIPASTKSLQRLDQMRTLRDLKKPNLYVDEIVHKVDFNVNEQGTEAAAATAGYLLRTGPNVSMRCDTPFLILVRHDPTKLPLFYGIVNIPA